MFRHVKAVTLLLAVASLTCAGCQSPTEPTDLDYMEVTAPSTVTASGPTGRTYRIPATSTEPEKIIEYPYKTTFSVSLRITSDASSKDGALDFPVDITQAQATVQQASGGIVVPPPTGTTIYSEVVPFATGNRFNAVNDTITITFDVYYDLPNRLKEALITMAFGFKDEKNATFSDSAQIRVSP